MYVISESGHEIPPHNLSSGEQNLLVLCYKLVFGLSNSKILLIDEPENSLDIDWQFELVNLLVHFNPNAQYFVTTHSPAIFGDGWGDKVWYMENIIK